MANKTLDCDFEVKEVTPAGHFLGYGSVYNTVDQGGDIVAQGAFSESLATWASKGRMPSMLLGHDSSYLPIGAYQSIKEDSIGLLIEGKLAIDTQLGGDVYKLLKMSAITGLSVGFRTRDDSYDRESGIRTIKKADLYEISLCNMPMNDSARIVSVKSIEAIDDLKSAEQYLREAGLSRTEAKAIIARVKSLGPRDAGEDDMTSLLTSFMSSKRFS